MSTEGRRVEAHYDQYPYPTVVSLARPRVPGFTRGTLSYLLRRRAADALPARARIWVAGCGTQQGIHWGLSWPEAEILATDISEGQLATTRALAQQLNVSNVRFERRDLLESEAREEFDFIVCTGVLHHTPDPERGLARLRAALKPEGALQLMVYSRMHRGPLRDFRDVVDALEPPDGDIDRRYAIACELLGATLQSGRCAPPYRSVFEQLWDIRERDRSFFADAIVHPLDGDYDVTDLLDYLARAELRHTNWLFPTEWDVGTYFGDGPASARLRTLAPVEQWKAIYTLAGHASPALEVLCEPAGAPARAPYSPEELDAMPIACDRGGTAFKIEGGRVVASANVGPYQKKNGMLVGRARGGAGRRYTWQLPDAVEPLLEACDGARTKAELVRDFESQADRDSLQALFDSMLPNDVGLLAPAWNR